MHNGKHWKLHPALTDTTTATTNSANTGDTAMNNSNSRGTEEPSTTNPSNGAASLLIVSETAELLTDDLEPPTAYGKFQIEPPIVGQTINELDYDYSDAWGIHIKIYIKILVMKDHHATTL
ncbi:hypothetical protein NIIDMKKI_79920 [Mycobacterium kansasii]|uniref:Uncharacterized protein n=1 Tax=Mycobacterium kansasii TaxID=1768 RepID=A0A7G1IP85_MYCKA|nr:hypothetical protein NIIDMKKI_79920 [Mycobacterium kansasii]